MSGTYSLWHHLHLRKVSLLCQIKVLYPPLYNLYGHLCVGSHPEGTLEITNISLGSQQVVLYQFAQGLSFKNNSSAPKYRAFLETSLFPATCLHPGQKQLNMNLFTFSNLQGFSPRATDPPVPRPHKSSLCTGFSASEGSKHQRRTNWDKNDN